MSSPAKLSDKCVMLRSVATGKHGCDFVVAMSYVVGCNHLAIGVCKYHHETVERATVALGKSIQEKVKESNKVLS